MMIPFLERVLHALSIQCGTQGFRQTVDGMERELIQIGLDRADNNKQRAADALGMKRTCLISRMKSLGIPLDKKARVQ